MENFNKLLCYVLFALFIIQIGIMNSVNAKRHTPLLIEDDGSRKTNRPAECQFGKTLKELGSTWYADLGPPFGIMYCIRCECVPVQKKRRIVARVQCRNIKNECPKPTCDDPVLLPGKCCKTCSGDNTSIIQDVPQSAIFEEEERNIKQFATLITARTSQILKREDMKSTYSINNPQNIVATGRFTLHKKNLYYSFYISEKANRPRSIQFMDNMGTILVEHNLSVPPNGPFSLYQNSTGKICGVWRRVPRDYRKLLKDDQIIIAILWGGEYQAELALAGKIEKYPALSTEILSSLLEPASGTSPEQMSGSGGTAIVSTISGGTPSIHLTLIVNGIFNPDEISDVPLNIRLESIDKKQIILEDIQKVKKPAHAINIIEVSSPVSPSDLRLLTRGKIFIIVESRKNPEHLRIQGQIVTRVACEIFQTVLASHSPDSATRTSGLAWLYMNKEGSLNYNMELTDLNYDGNTIVTLIDDSGKRKIELEDLTSLSRVTSEAAGTIDRLGPRVLEALYSGDLTINVGAKTDQPIVKGRLVSRPVADARDSPTPILFKKYDKLSPANVAGMAWLAVDNYCNVQYEITLTGLHSHRHLELYIEETPIEAPGARVTRKLLDEFSGNYMEGIQIGLSIWEVAKLETSACYLEIFSKELNRPILRAKLKNVKVPNHCFPMDSDNELPTNSHNMNDHSDNNLPPMGTQCYHSDRFYDEGQQWSSALESCTMCSCMSRRVKCEHIKCPPLRCKSEDIRTRNGGCCPFCMNAKTFEEFSNSKIEKGCRLGDQFYPAGSSWHPYVPPTGFDTCAICTCDANTLKVSCPKTQCPPLACSEKDAYRPHKTSCCKKCPELRLSLNRDKKITEFMKDQEIVVSANYSTAETLANGGCKTSLNIYENGQEWHPVVASLGEQKCVKCRCKDGNITCDRKRCTRSICNNRIMGRNRKDLSGGSQLQQQELNSEIGDCCSTQCRRARRHNHNPRKLEREKEKQ